MSKTGFQAFAAGMIVATSVLGGTYLLSDKQSATADAVKKEVTEKEVKSFLTDKGQTSIATEEYEELLATKDKALQQTETKKQAPKEDSTEEVKPVEEKKEEAVKYKLTIQSGMTTSEVSDLLEQNGIITDSFEFDQYLIKGGYHQKVQLGSFDVQKGMDHKQLAEAITK